MTENPVRLNYIEQKSKRRSIRLEQIDSAIADHNQKVSEEQPTKKKKKITHGMHGITLVAVNASFGISMMYIISLIV